VRNLTTGTRSGTFSVTGTTATGATTLAVDFTGGTTADTIIERLVGKYAETHSLRAATADGMIRETVSAFGAHWLSPESLRQLCDDVEGEMRRRIGKK
jgi:predicted RNA-binding protein with PIN domain